MENPTEFDLNRQILAWRENLGQSPAIDGENLSELEAHLRDSIATLQTQGLSASEAFLVATRRMGSEGTLAAEFGKVNRSAVWFRRILWMLVGLQLWSVVNGLTGTLTRAISTLILGQYLRNQWLQGDATRHETLTNSVYIATQVLATVGSLALGWWLVVYQWRRLCRWAGHWSHGYRLLVFSGLLLGTLAVAGSPQALVSVLIFRIFPMVPGVDVLAAETPYAFRAVFVDHAVIMLLATLWLFWRRIGRGPVSTVAEASAATVIGAPGKDLPTHLQAVLPGLQATDLSVGEALMLANQRANGGYLPAQTCGSPSPLASGWERAFWMMLGLQLCGISYLSLRTVTSLAASVALTTARQFLNADQSSAVINEAIPVVAFSLVQILTLAGSLTLCWWLLLRRGAQIGAWLNGLWQPRNWPVATAVVFLILMMEICLPLLLPVMSILVPDAHAIPVKIFSTAYLLNGVGHSITLLILTMMLARKQFKFGRTAGVR